MMPINISFSMNFGSLRLVSLSEQPPFGKELDIQMTDCYLSISANLVFKVFPYLFDTLVIGTDFGSACAGWFSLIIAISSL